MDEVNEHDNLLALMSKIAPITTLLQNKTAPQANPIFALKEYSNCYLLSIDLPSVQDTVVTVGHRPDHAEVIEVRDENDPSAILFRCESVGNKVRSYYKNGVLWMMLPKASVTDFLDLPRIERAMKGFKV